MIRAKFRVISLCTYQVLWIEIPCLWHNYKKVYGTHITKRSGENRMWYSFSSSSTRVIDYVLAPTNDWKCSCSVEVSNHMDVE